MGNHERMSVEETLAQAKEKLAELKQERKEKEQELYAAWAHDAETAGRLGAPSTNR